jgi:hypothetical protein
MNRSLITFLAWLPMSAMPASPTHCASGEDVLFNCQVANSKKVASLCGANYFATGATFLHAYVQYRFGAPGAIEFVYPKTTAYTDILDKFRANAEGAAGQSFSDSFLDFQNEGYVYEIWYREERIAPDSTKRSASVNVWEVGKRGMAGATKTLICRNNDEHIELYMKDIVARFSSTGTRYWEQLK